MGSTRLPGKVLMPVYKNYSTIEILIKKLKKYNLVIATSTNKEDDVIHKISKKNKINCFRGSNENVLGRFIKCACKYNFKRVVRICSDNPFLDTSLLEIMLRGDNLKHDYLSFSFKGMPSIKFSFGIFAEIISVEALIRASELSQEKTYKEHVTNYVYENPNIFNVKLLPIELFIKDFYLFRLTLDTNKDLLKLRSLAGLLDPFKFSIIKDFSTNKNYINQTNE